MFQFIKAYLYFNDAEETVNPQDLPRLTRFMKAFFLLYKGGKVAAPDLTRLNFDGLNDLIDFWHNDREMKFRAPTNKEEAEALKVVTSENYKLSPLQFGPERVSVAVVDIFSRYAQYPARCQMTREESAALGIYIGMGFSKLNPYLRSGLKDNPQLNLLATLVNRALDKIDDSRRLVYRTTTFLTQPDMPEAVYRTHKMGSVVNYLAFTSTATSPKYRSNFLIYSKTGKGLGLLTVESEILFRSQTKFLVRYNSCEDEQKQSWQGCNVILEEIDHR